MTGNATHGFDVVYEISRDRLLQVIMRQIEANLSQALFALPVRVPVPIAGQDLTQLGFASAVLDTGITGPTLAFAQREGGLLLSIPFRALDLRLEDIPASVSFPAGLAGLEPTSLLASGEPTTLEVDLRILIDDQTGVARLRIVRIAVDDRAGAAAPRVNNIADLPPGVIPAGLNQQAWNSNVRTAVESVIIEALTTIVLPVDTDVMLPNAGPCDIFARDLQLKLLPGTADGEDSLAFFVTLLQNNVGAGEPDAFTDSNISAGDTGSLLVANALLLEILCCTIPDSELISGLEAQPIRDTRDGRQCCIWRNIDAPRLGSTTFASADEIRLCIDDNGVEFAGELRQEGTGWNAQIDFSAQIGFELSAGTVAPVFSDPVIDVDVDKEWWVYLIEVVPIVIGAVVGSIIPGVGTVAGATVGGLIGALVSLALYAALRGVLLALEDTLGVDSLGDIVSQLDGLAPIPLDLTDVFGSLERVENFEIDDFHLGGPVALTDIAPPIASGLNVVLQPGQTIDLDSGTIFPADAMRIDGDADLAWQISQPEVVAFRFSGRAGLNAFNAFPMELRQLGPARLITLNGESYASLGRSEIERLAFPQQGGQVISESAIPVCGAGYNLLQRGPLVFAVRTTEGRYARCAAWLGTGRTLELSFTTFSTPLPLDYTQSWSFVKGAEVDSRFPTLGTSHNVAWTGRIRALPTNMREPVHVQWRWNGGILAGAGMLPATSASFSITNQRITIRTAMGKDLEGELCVFGTGADGLRFSRCVTVQRSGVRTTFPGSIYVADASDVPHDTPRPEVALTTETFEVQLERILRRA